MQFKPPTRPSRGPSRGMGAWAVRAVATTGTRCRRWTRVFSCPLPLVNSQSNHLVTEPATSGISVSTMSPFARNLHGTGLRERTHSLPLGLPPSESQK